MSYQIYDAEVVFPKPKYWEKDKQGNDLPYGPFYSICLSLPEGAPGTDYIENYKRYQAYMSFNPDSEEASYLLGLTTGDRLQVLWDQRGKKGKYKAIVPDEAIGIKTTTPAPSNVTNNRITTTSSKPANNQAQQESDGLLTESELEAMGMAVDEIMPVLAYAYESASGYEIFKQAGAEVTQKMAVTAFLYAKDRYRRIKPELVAAPPKQVPDIIFGIDPEKLDIILGIDPEKLPGSLLEAIAEASPYVDDGTQAAAYLKIFGLSRDDIDIDDKDTWWKMFTIANNYGKVLAERGEREAKIHTANFFNLEIPD